MYSTSTRPSGPLCTPPHEVHEHGGLGCVKGPNKPHGGSTQSMAQSLTWRIPSLIPQDPRIPSTKGRITRDGCHSYHLRHITPRNGQENSTKAGGIAKTRSSKNRQIQSNHQRKLLTRRSYVLHFHEAQWPTMHSTSRSPRTRWIGMCQGPK